MQLLFNGARAAAAATAVAAVVAKQGDDALGQVLGSEAARISLGPQKRVG